jgi:hypothetical protein
VTAVLLTDDAAAWVAAYDRGEAARAARLATQVALMGYVPDIALGPVYVAVERHVDHALRS